MRIYPNNYIGVLIFTICESFLLSNILYFYTDETIIKALFGTALSVGILGIVAIKTKVDVLTSKFFFYLLIAQLFNSFLGFLFFGVDSMIYQLISSIAICAYLIVDIQMLLGNKSHSF